MRDFCKVSTTVWESDRFNALPSDDARYLFLYTLTSSHSNSAGCYRLPEAYATADLRWATDRYRAALSELVASEMVDFDPKHSVIRIAKWFDHNPAMNEGHRKGIEQQLAKVPSVELARTAFDEMMTAWETKEAERRENAAAKANGISPQMRAHLARTKQ